MKFTFSNLLILIFIFALIVTCFVGCNTLKAFETTSPTVSPNPPSPSSDTSASPEAKLSYDLHYVNEECGYELTFPDSWAGKFFVDETYPEFISVCFIPECREAKTLADKYGRGGLLMFFIINESALEGETLDSIRRIGKIGDAEYFYATGTDFALGTLPEIANSAVGAEYLSDTITQEDIDTAKADWALAEQFLQETDSVLLTFKALGD